MAPRGHREACSVGLMSPGGEGAGILWLHLHASPAREAGGAARTRALKGSRERAVLTLWEAGEPSRAPQSRAQGPGVQPLQVTF